MRRHELLFLLSLLMLGFWFPHRAQAASASDVESAAVVPEVRFDVPHVVLGTTPEVGLSIRTHVAPGAEPTPPEIFVVGGRVDGLKNAGPGLWRARFSPGEEKYPRLAFVVAVFADDVAPRAGMGVLPLWGKGRIHIATKPHARVVAHIADASFGPVLADARGDAHLDIVAPPLVREGRAHSTDDLGNASTRSFDLGVPPIPAIAVLPERVTVNADALARKGVRCWVAMVDGELKPVEAARFSLVTSLGHLTSPRMRAPGLFEVQLDHAEARGAEVQLQAKPDDGAQTAGEARIRVTPGEPARVVFEDAPAALRAGESRDVALRAQVLDRAGNPAATDGVRVAASIGRVELAQTGKDGSLALRWLLPTRVGGSSARLTVRDAGTRVLGRHELQLLSASTNPMSMQTRLGDASRAASPLMLGVALDGTFTPGSVFAVGPDVSMLFRTPAFDSRLFVGIDFGARFSLSSAASPTVRFYPLLFELAWRPAEVRGVQMHLGGAAGVVALDVEQRPSSVRTLTTTGTGHGVLGVGTRLGEGTLELTGRAGFLPTLIDKPGVWPLFASVSLGYRIEL